MANVIDKVAGLVVGPQGPQGPQGPKGDTGQTGPQGATGATGATPNLTMGTVTTLEPDSPATATITGTAENPVLNLGLPKGRTGEVSQAEFDEVAEDVSQLKSELTATETYIIGKGNLLNHTTWTDGKIGTDGTIKESTVSEYTALIPVDDGIEYTYVCDITRTDIPTRILGYTDNGAFIGLVVSIAGGNTGRRINTFIPSDSVKNIRISRYGINPSVSLVKGKTIQGEINVIDGQIADIQNNIEISGIYKPVSGFSGITTYSGYVNDSGVIVDGGTGWVRSDYIPTAEGASIVASLKGYSTSPIVAFYDSAKVYMASESILANKQLVVDVNTYVPSGVAYAIFASQTNYDGRGFTIGTPAKISEALDIVADDLYGFKGLKVLCLGDSLTAGRDGLGNILSRNYPYYMQQTMLKGCVVDNKGVVGTTSKTYWNNYIDDVTLDNTIDIVLMMWGTNGGLVSTNALATDVEPYDDYNDYADTGVGCYCKIIEYVMGQTQNHAQVILITPPYNGDTSINDRVILAQPVVKQIAERYNLPVINMFKCGIGKFNFSTFMPDDSVHFNEAGYRWIGTYIGSCVNAITAKRNI